MSSAHKGDSLVSPYPRTLSSIAVSVCGLAVFLILTSLLLVSQPIGSAVTGYFYRVDHSSQYESQSVGNEPVHDSQHDGKQIDDSHVKSDSSMPGDSQSVIAASQEDSGGWIDNKNHTSRSQGTKDMINDQQREENMSFPGPTVVSETKATVDQQGNDITENSTSPKITKDFESARNPSPGLLTSDIERPGLPVQSLAPALGDKSPSSSANSGCDLYHGKWVYDSSGPLYSNNSCPVLAQMQNCQGNGRPDKDYENWRWKPSECDLPRFDGRKFLELMRGKTLAFIGDSVARNQMESLLCILWQVEVPKNRGNRRMQRYYFRSTSTMIARIWSSWLVHQTSDPFGDIPAEVVKLHLDAPDEVFMEFIPNFDVIVLSSGHWFAKRSAYILNNELVGGQLWWPDKSQPMKINSIDAFGVSVETILTSIVTHPNYTGLTIVRSFSPDHYEGGAWNTGGSCTGKMEPASEIVENGFTNIMHEKQEGGFKRAIKKMTNRSRLKFMDITRAFEYRHDGHPGPYRSPDPNKITKRGPDGKPPPQDCLHWCMPGPVDTWNELVLELIRRDFEGSQ